MKKFTITFSLKGILLSLSGILVFTLITSFITNDSLVEEDREEITLQEAKQFYDNHQQNRSSSNIDYVTISKDQFNALKKCDSRDAGGFRLFSGRDGNGQEITIVVAISPTNAELLGHIEMANSDKWAACPPTCDAPSQIAD